MDVRDADANDTNATNFLVEQRACGDNGRIERTDDGGKNWKKLPTPNNAVGFMAMWWLGSEEVITIGECPSTLLRSREDGVAGEDELGKALAFRQDDIREIEHEAHS